MAEPVTETTAWDGDGAGGAETEVVASGLAWSADDADDKPQRQPLWRRVVPTLLVVLAVGAVVVTASMLIDKIERRAPVAAAATSTPQATTAAEPSLPPTSPASWSGQIPSAAVEHVTTPPGSDDLFIADLRNVGIVFVDPARAAASGRLVCTYLAQGHTKIETVRVLMASDSSVSVMDAARFVVAAVNVYCPQYGTAE